MIESSSDSHVRCQEHPNETITNYCCNFNCLRPLCPECVEEHTKLSHSKQQIESWKNCLNRSYKNIRNTLTRLKQIQNRLGSHPVGRPVQAIEQQAVRKLHHVRRQLHELVDELFAFHEKQIREHIRREFRHSPVDISKLKLAIQQLERLGMKLTNPNSVLSGLKKSILLDHESLVQHFQNQMRMLPKIHRQQFHLNADSDSINRIRKQLESLFIHDLPHHIHHQPYYDTNVPKATSLPIYSNNYFAQTGGKYLHYFVPFQKQLKLLRIEDAQNGNPRWITINLNIRSQIPSFAKSIITPEGHIYLTGGSDPNTKAKLNSIQRYNQQAKSLDDFGQLVTGRSSHSVCYINGNIYLVGGFKVNNQICNECQVYNIASKKSKPISSLRFPSANCSIASFNNKFFFKFGGLKQKESPNNNIEMYSISQDNWRQVDPALSSINQKFWLLSYSASVQINSNQIFVFGGYNDAEDERPSNLSFTLHINQKQMAFILKNIDTFPLPQAQGFWDNTPIVYNSKVFAIQNVTDEDELHSIIDEKRLLIFNGKRWNAY